MFTETLTVTVVSLNNGGMPMPGATADQSQQITVTLRQPNGNQFTINDAIANAAKYNVGETLPHSVG